MAVHQCVSFLTVVIILLSKGCESQSFECGRITANQTGNPGSWPWRVFIDVLGNNVFEGSLITDQWVLTLASSVQNYPVRDIAVYRHSNEPLSNPNVYFPLETLTCDPGNELCLLKLASPLNLTDQIQPICLASESSTFYSGTESWITTFSAVDTTESNLEIIGNNECQCYAGLLSNDAICAGLTERDNTCLGNLGGPLMNKNDSVWVQSGVLSSDSCSEPTKVGVFVRVSEYQNWITETVSGTPPIFVNFTSPDTDIDLYFTCFTDPTADPTADLTADPTADPTADLTADPTADLTADLEYLTATPECDSVFCGGESLIHFTHFTALCFLVVSLHVFVGNGGI